MIILKDILRKYLQSVQVELPRAKMVIDPRPICLLFDVPPHLNDPRSCRFQCDYHENGTTVTITRLTRFDDSLSGSWLDQPYSFRAYDPATETVPSFDSTTYEYQGQDGETAPFDTTVLLINPSVTVIKEDAFSDCDKITKCIMHDGVHTIEEGAFFNCSDMKVIHFSRSLTRIREDAFWGCKSLQAVFLPPTVNQIDGYAFAGCFRLLILSFPPNIDISKMGKGMLRGCFDFFQTTGIPEYHRHNDNRVHQEILDFYRNQHPLHKVCMDTRVTRQTIQQCINTYKFATFSATVSITDHNDMTPFHILALNPLAECGFFALNKDVADVQDCWGKTPLDYFKVHHMIRVDALLAAINDMVPLD